MLYVHLAKYVAAKFIPLRRLLRKDYSPDVPYLSFLAYFDYFGVFPCIGRVMSIFDQMMFSPAIPRVDVFWTILLSLQWYRG